MKRLFILSLLVLATITANAQICLGYFTKNCNWGKKGEEVVYRQGRNGKVYLGDGAEYSNPIPASCVRFSGYYVGMIVDPRDNYVNIRKGPGTNFPVVKRVYTYNYIVGNDLYETYQLDYLFKKTNTNWYKIYSDPGKLIGYIYKDRIVYDDSPEL